MLSFAREGGTIPPQRGDFWTSRVFPIDAAPFFAQVFGLGERMTDDSQEPCPHVPIASLWALLGLSSQPGHISAVRGVQMGCRSGERGSWQCSRACRKGLDASFPS